MLNADGTPFVLKHADNSDILRAADTKIRHGGKRARELAELIVNLPDASERLIDTGYLVYTQVYRALRTPPDNISLYHKKGSKLKFTKEVTARMQDDNHELLFISMCDAAGRFYSTAGALEGLYANAGEGGKIDMVKSLRAKTKLFYQEMQAGVFGDVTTPLAVRAGWFPSFFRMFVLVHHEDVPPLVLDRFHQGTYHRFDPPSTANDNIKKTLIDQAKEGFKLFAPLLPFQHRLYTAVQRPPLTRAHKPGGSPASPLNSLIFRHNK